MRLKVTLGIEGRRDFLKFRRLGYGGREARRFAEIRQRHLATTGAGLTSVECNFDGSVRSRYCTLPGKGWIVAASHRDPCEAEHWAALREAALDSLAVAIRYKKLEARRVRFDPAIASLRRALVWLQKPILDGRECAIVNIRAAIAQLGRNP